MKLMKNQSKEMIIRAVVDIHADGDVYIKNGKRFSLIGCLAKEEMLAEFPNKQFLKARKLVSEK